MTQLPEKGDLPDEIGEQAKKSAFQIRSSWAQFLRFSIFERVDFSITYVFSIPLNIPTPPASTFWPFKINTLRSITKTDEYFENHSLVTKMNFYLTERP